MRCCLLGISTLYRIEELKNSLSLKKPHVVIREIREDILVINSGRVWKRYGQILSEVGFDDSTISLCTPDIEFED